MVVQCAARLQHKRQRNHDGRWQLIRSRAATFVFFPFVACIEMIRVRHTPNAGFWGRLVEVAGGAASSSEEAPSHASALKYHALLHSVRLL